jgi:hypothetical protein
MKYKLITNVCCLLLCIGSFGQTIVSGEYFWDNDPGVGNGIAFDAVDGGNVDMTFNPSTTGLNEGPHIIGFRFVDDNNVWGETETKRVVVHHFTGAEYFWDTDPGAGNATPAALNSGDQLFNGEITISSAGVKPGNRLLGVRTKGIGDVWSPPFVKRMYVPTLYTEGEYFWDTDPGVGLANSFSLAQQSDTLNQNVEISTGDITPGLHYLYTRVRGLNGSFGTTYKKRVIISRTIVGGEYFWDTDPGIGNGTSIGVISSGDSVQVCGELSTIGFAPGDYMLYVRTVSDDGLWGHAVGVPVTVTPNVSVVGCDGDFDLSGNVGTTDLLLFLTGFGQASACSFDLTGDGVVGSPDLLIFLSRFGTICN